MLGRRRAPGRGEAFAVRRRLGRHLDLPSSADGRAAGFAFEFPARVTDGTLNGERGTSGEPGWMQLDGPIAPNGAANLVAEGLTNVPSYALYKVEKGTHFKHAVQAQFGARHGSGTWKNQDLRLRV